MYSKIAAAAQAALNAVAEANPYVLIATAIIAVGAALTYWFTQTESGKQAWASLCKVATQAWNAFYPIIKPAIDGIVQAWNSLVAAFQQAWATLQPVFQQLGSAISSAFSALAPIIQQILPILSLVGQIIGGLLVGSLIILIATISGVISTGRSSNPPASSKAKPTSSKACIATTTVPPITAFTIKTANGKVTSMPALPKSLKANKASGKKADNK